MDHVALYQYVICGPGPQKTKWGENREIEDHVKFEKKDINLQFYQITFLSRRPQSITLFLITLTFHVCFAGIYEFKFTSSLMFAISKSGDSYKLL